MKDIKGVIGLGIIHALRYKKISVADARRFSFIFNFVETDNDILKLCEFYANKYPFLKNILSQKKEEKSELKEGVIEDFLRDIIKINPAIALQITKDISENKNMNIDEIREKYPDFDNYLKARENG